MSLARHQEVAGRVFRLRMERMLGRGKAQWLANRLMLCRALGSKRGSTLARVAKSSSPFDRRAKVLYWGLLGACVLLFVLSLPHGHSHGSSSKGWS